MKKAEHPFLIVKKMFHAVKTSYRGLRNLHKTYFKADLFLYILRQVSTYPFKIMPLCCLRICNNLTDFILSVIPIHFLAKKQYYCGISSFHT